MFCSHVSTFCFGQVQARFKKCLEIVATSSFSKHCVVGLKTRHSEENIAESKLSFQIVCFMFLKLDFKSCLCPNRVSVIFCPTIALALSVFRERMDLFCSWARLRIVFSITTVETLRDKHGNRKCYGSQVFFACSFSMDVRMNVEPSMDVVGSGFATNHAPIYPPRATLL